MSKPNVNSFNFSRTPADPTAQYFRIELERFERWLQTKQTEQATGRSAELDRVNAQLASMSLIVQAKAGTSHTHPDVSMISSGFMTPAHLSSLISLEERIASLESLLARPPSFAFYSTNATIGTLDQVSIAKATADIVLYLPKAAAEKTLSIANAGSSVVTLRAQSGDLINNESMQLLHPSDGVFLRCVQSNLWIAF